MIRISKMFFLLLPLVFFMFVENFSATMQEMEHASGTISIGETISMKRGLGLALLHTLKPAQLSASRGDRRTSYPHFHPMVRVREGQIWRSNNNRYAEPGGFYNAHYNARNELMGSMHKLVDEDEKDVAWADDEGDVNDRLPLDLEEDGDWTWDE